MSTSRWRRKNDDTARPHRLTIKLSDTEDAQISAEAKIRQISKPAVLMRAYRADSATAAAYYDMLAADVLMLRRTMAQISRNLNQAVKLEHTRRLEGVGEGPELSRDLQALIGDLREAMDMIDQVVDKASQ